MRFVFEMDHVVQTCEMTCPALICGAPLHHTPPHPAQPGIFSTLCIVWRGLLASGTFGQHEHLQSRGRSESRLGNCSAAPQDLDYPIMRRCVLCSHDRLYYCKGIQYSPGPSRRLSFVSVAFLLFLILPCAMKAQP